MSTRLAGPQPATQRSAAARCASCGGDLSAVYYYLPSRSDRFCAACITSRPHCDSCAAPVGEDGWRLHDGRVLCAHCHRVAVYSPQEAAQLYDQVVAQLAAQPRLELRIGAAFRLVDQPALLELASEGGASPGEDEHTLGLYHRHGRLRVVYALYGLPRLLLRTVIAHELAHAWQGENAPLLQDPLWREGFAEWVAYCHLLHIGAAKAARRMLQAQHPYLPGLQRCLALERRLGADGVLEQMRKLE